METPKRYIVSMVINEVSDFETIHEDWEELQSERVGVYRTIEAADKRIGELLAASSKSYVDEFAEGGES